MDFRQLNYFVAVAEEGNMGRAAQRLCLSQPPLTRHIKTLESDLGVQLFVRTPRGMTLTAAGETLLPEAQSILRMLHAASDRAQQATSVKRGLLNVGLFGSGTLGVVPQVLRQFKDEHPTIDIGLHYAQTPAQIQALRQGRVLIVFERMLPNEADIETEVVTTEPLMLAVSDRHRLAQQKSVHVSELRTETLRIGTLPKTAATTIELCRRHGFEPHFAPPASDVIMMTLLTAIGTEVALVPWSMTHLHFPGITYLPLESAGGAYNDLYCYYLREERSPLLASILETIRTMRSSGFFQRTNHFEKG